jgi:hypothetical protein
LSDAKFVFRHILGRARSEFSWITPGKLGPADTCIFDDFWAVDYLIEWLKASQTSEIKRNAQLFCRRSVKADMKMFHQGGSHERSPTASEASIRARSCPRLAFSQGR